MRWKPKQKHFPKLGDMKSEVRFAWLPVICSDNTRVWLESYVVELEFRTWREEDEFGREYSVMCWATTNTKTA